MHPVVARTAFIALACGGLVALGLAQSSRQFAWIEAESPSGARLALSGPIDSERQAGALTVGLAEDGTRVELTVPADGRAAEVVPALVSITDAAGVRQGRGTLAIEESGTYLAGRFEAELDGLSMRGGLRVRAGSVVERHPVGELSARRPQ